MFESEDQRGDRDAEPGGAARTRADVVARADRRARDRSDRRRQRLERRHARRREHGTGATGTTSTRRIRTARGAQRGIAVATGATVLFVDDDVVLPPYFVAAHARARRPDGPS